MVCMSPSSLLGALPRGRGDIHASFRHPSKSFFEEKAKKEQALEAHRKSEAATPRRGRGRSPRDARFSAVARRPRRPCCRTGSGAYRKFHLEKGLRLRPETKRRGANTSANATGRRAALAAASSRKRRGGANAACGWATARATATAWRVAGTGEAAASTAWRAERRTAPVNRRVVRAAGEGSDAEGRERRGGGGRFCPGP